MKIAIFVACAWLITLGIGIANAACPAGAASNLQYFASAGNCGGLSGKGMPLSNGTAVPTLFPQGNFIDGTTFAYSSTGIQNAINAGIGGGVGTTSYLPGTESLTNNEISMSSTVSMKSEQCLIGTGHGSTFLSFSGSGPAFKFPDDTHDACLIGVTIYVSNPASGQECIEMDGNNTGGNPTHGNLIRDVYCQFNGKVAGTTGIKFQGDGTTKEPSDVSLNHVEDSYVFDAATPFTINDSEQDFFSDNDVDGDYTAPAVTFGADAALIHWNGGRIAGGGITGHAFSLPADKITVNTEVDSGAADCFDDTGGNNWLKCEVPGVSPTLGTIAATSTAYYNNRCQNGC